MTIPHLSKIKDNKLVVYLITRYVTYFIQFLTSLLIANKLGPTNYGVWGYILLLISYFSTVNFGLGNSMSVILVQNRNNVNAQSEYIKNDLFLVTILGLLIVVIMLFYSLCGMTWFSRYTITYEFYIICIIAILTHYNLNFVNILRVKNDFYRIAFYQSIVPFLLFFCTLLFSGVFLLQALLYSTLVGNLLSLIVFSYKKPFELSGKISMKIGGQILFKGWWLFLYNLFFYLILISTRTLISHYYSVEDFGFFSFSFTLGDAVLLLFQAASTIVLPKVLSQLGEDGNKRNQTIKLIDNTYVVLVYFAVLLVCCLFPLLLRFFPKYESCNTCMSLVAITMALYTNSYSYISFLMTNDKEKKLMLISLASLIVNIIVAYLLIKVINLPYTYIIISTLVSYYLFYALCVLAVNKEIKYKFPIFNWRIHFPLIVAIILTILKMDSLMLVVVSLFVLLNIGNFKKTLSLLSAIWKDYKLINV